MNYVLTKLETLSNRQFALFVLGVYSALAYPLSLLINFVWVVVGNNWADSRYVIALVGAVLVVAASVVLFIVGLLVAVIVVDSF